MDNQELNEQFFECLNEIVNKFKSTGVSGEVLEKEIAKCKLVENNVLRMTQTVEQSPVSVEMTDTEGNLEYVNPKYEQTSGYTWRELKGQNPRILKSGFHPKEFYEELWKTVKAGRVWKGEFRNKRKDGQLYWESALISPLKNSDGVITAFIAIKEEITERKEQEEKLARLKEELERSNRELEQKNKENEQMLVQLEELTLTDPLTGVLNRRGLQRVLAREGSWAERYGTSLLAVLLDLDNFKRINDTYGHVAGDAVLREVTKNLRNTLRSVDYIARIGGDEFIILLPQLRLGDGFGVAEKIRYAISNTECIINESVIQVTGSLGLVQVKDENFSIDGILRKGQFVLKCSKVSGKNRIISEGSQEGALKQVLVAMNQAQSYHVVKQPIYRLADMSLFGYEFLSRLNVHMFEMPQDFFHLCQENQMLTIVDRLCLQNCVQSAKNIQHGIHKHLNLYPTTAVEIPPENILKEFPLDRRKEFCLELSEELIISDLSRVLKPIMALKEGGIRIAIDDVGFGRSSLESLIILEPDVIKIDKKINIGIARDNGRQRSLERLLKVARSLNAQTIVEGIETEDDLRVIRSLGVELGQGFLFGSPC
ncbi:MAG: diguanylate cyclase [Candidatus Omnitrophica bacterium]|nr:diguanylate cyclase [Candidatus Omnitrophota bacterium]